ncbi:MAG: anaerobic ribonucleoside-triphosphate reductase activating protein [Oscillibacter sp.]
MRIAGTVQDSIVDGPGFRFTVFAQGCRHGCPGCHNPQTHDPLGGREWSVAELLDRLRSNPLTDGLTLSGGEPFDQAADCLALAQAAHAMGLNVWCWTGELFEALRDQGTASQQALLREVDVLVDGPFLLSLRSLSLPWRGSRNQRVILVGESLRLGQVILRDD